MSTLTQSDMEVMKKIEDRRKGKRIYKRTMKHGICSKCKSKFSYLQYKYPLLCGDCRIKIFVKDYRKEQKASFNPQRY